MLTQPAPPTSLELDVFSWNEWTESVGSAGRFRLEQLDDFIGMRNVMRGLDGVVQYQFSQIGERDYVMKMVTLPGFAETDRLNQRLAELLGDQARISVEFVASIPPLPSGKRPYIVNEWRSGSSDARRKSR